MITELEKLQDLAEKEKANIDAWLTQESRSLIADIEHFETLIQESNSACRYKSQP